MTVSAGVRFVQVVHETSGAERNGDEQVLASDVELADTVRKQTKGLMFRESLPEDYAMLFEFDEPPRWTPGILANLRSIHMLFVKVPLDVVWLLDDEVQQVSTLSPWTGLGLARADTVIELPAGAADGVEVGDTVRIDEEGS